MSQTIFKKSLIVDRSFLQTIFGQHPEENAVIELNNLFASKSILQISQNEISEIENRYNINLLKEFKLNLEEFYATHLNYCLADKSLSNEELEELKHLKMLLSLDNNTIDKLHNRIGEIVYKTTFEEAVSDGRLSESEKAFLSKLESDLKLPKELSEKIASEAKLAFMEQYKEKIISDQRLSPNEEKELQAISSSLNINIMVDNKTQQQLDKLKLYWALENIELPTIEPDIVVQKSENCYFQITNVNWYELRSVRQRVSYSGYSTRFKVAKGFYLNSGSYSPKSYGTDQMTLIDNGSIYLTNKRIIFVGHKKNSNIRLEKIINITPYSNGVEIDKETGKRPLLQFQNRADIFCIIIERLLREIN
jgi:hypothetical protein